MVDASGRFMGGCRFGALSFLPEVAVPLVLALLSRCPGEVSDGGTCPSHFARGSLRAVTPGTW